jgi:hypothetical protein
LQAFLASFSKEMRFQCQAFPKNSLAVLWDFKGLRPLQTDFPGRQTFSAGAARKAAPAGGNIAKSVAF